MDARPHPRRRTALLFLIVFAAYVATLGMHAFAGSDYAGNEPHYLLAAQSLIHDGNIDVADEYSAQDYRDFYPYRLEHQGQTSKGTLYEPNGLGFPLFIAPAYAIGGAVGVELFLALIAALAVALAYLLALRITTDPWAFGAAALVGLSPPLLAYGTAVYPELTAAAALGGAALLALRLDEHITNRAALGCFTLLGFVPWLGTKFVPIALLIGVYAARSLLRARRSVLAIGSVEVALFSVALYAGLNESIYGGPTPYGSGAGTAQATGDPSFPVGYLDRAYRLVALWIDRDFGLLRWAPIFALVFVGAWYVYRSRRERLSRALPQLRGMERGATLCVAAVGLQLLVATFLAPTIFGFWFPARQLLAIVALAVPLIAIGMRHLPRLAALLGALTLLASGWLYVTVRFDGGSFVADRPDAPFGPLTNALPYFGSAGWPYALSAAIAVAAVALAAFEAHRWRTPPRG